METLVENMRILGQRKQEVKMEVERSDEESSEDRKGDE